MKILSINSCNYGSTGKIMLSISEIAKTSGNEAYTCCPDERSNRKKTLHNHILFGNRYFRNIHLLFGKLTGFQGCMSFIDTLLFLKQINKIKPDIIHLHNLHNCYINLPSLFNFIKKYNIPVIWTLHDCWAFTGQCPHFTMAKCDKWKNSCYKCPQYREYPKAYVDRTKTMYRQKKKWFTGVEDMTIVTPSQWLADLVKQSFLQDYPVKVINNGIDLDIFKPTPSNFREKYNLNDKFIVLGVAFGWGKRKGLDVFVELSKKLDVNKYQIVLVGTDANIDKQLPSNVISIHRTQNQMEIAEIYTAADVFANPTREENYPTVNMEAIACGTPVITFNTGGSPECINERSGVVVDCDDIEAMEREIVRICEDKPYTVEACLERAKSFDMNDRFGEYIKLYKEIYDKK